MAGTSPTRPIPTSQLTETPLSHSNCTETCGTMCEQRHSVGRFHHGPDAIRAATGDTVGGSTYEQIRAGVSKLTGGKVILEPRYGLTRSNLRDEIAGGRAGAVGIDCSVTVNTTRRTGNYTGRHSVFVNRYVWRAASTTTCSCELLTKVAHAEFDVCDPGKYLQTNTKFMRWSASLLYRAAEKHGGGSPNSPVIATLLTRDTEGVTRTAVEAGTLYADASTSATPVGSYASGKAFTVLATADGTGWPNPAGATMKNWHKVKTTTTAAWAKGRSLQ